MGKFNPKPQDGTVAWSPAEREIFVHASRKNGWTGSSYGDQISFGVRGNARVLVALLCSYDAESVGNATAFLHPANERPDASHRVGVPLVLRWTMQSSQQCLANVGTTAGDDDQLLTLRVASEKRGAELNQVKIYGIYEQDLHLAYSTNSG